MSRRWLWFLISAVSVLALMGPARAQDEPTKRAPAKSATAKEQAGDDSERQSQSRNKLKEIGIAFQYYYDVFGRFPTSTRDKNGKPFLSWRVEILPFVEAADLYNEFHLDEPWDSDHNRRLVAKMPDVFRAPGIDERDKTVYLAAVGPSAMFPVDKSDPRKPREVSRLTVNNEPRSLAWDIRLADITDGTSQTITVVEASPKRAVTWTKPDDLEFDAKKPRAGLDGVHPGGFNALFVDGRVRFIPLTTDDDVLRNLFNPSDGNAIPQDLLK